MTDESMTNKKSQWSNVSGQMSVLGIDPGLGRIGWGILEKKSGTISATAWGRIETSAKKSLADRLCSGANDLQLIIKQHRPDAIAIEKLFFAKNIKTAMDVAQMRGAILLVVAQCTIPLYEYTPLEVKQTLTGFGRAEKRQIQMMVKALFGVTLPASHDDTADAIAIAYTALVHTKTSNPKL